MNAPLSVTWYRRLFKVFDPSRTRWKDAPGVYIFAGRTPDGLRWSAKYVGRTLSFRNRLGPRITADERWSEAIQKGATHVHARIVHTEHERRTLEKELIDTFNPPLNAR